MTDEATTVDVPVAPPPARRGDSARHTARRVHHGVRKPSNWFQLVRFGAVGATGYVVNLVTFTVLVHVFNLDYRVAATGAFLVAVTNNFAWNRHWTFDARDGHAGFQAARFLTVSLVAFLFNLAFLELLVSVLGLAEVPAQALAVAFATPLNFVGNKLWTFDR
jgi:dolichol-phosphate mannosyltransferase